MAQQRLDKFMSEGIGSKLLKSIRAKSVRGEITERDALLISHVIKALNRSIELYDFLESLGDSISYEPLRNPPERKAMFKDLAKAIIIHDLGKVSLDFQRRLYRDERLPQELLEFLKESNGIKTYGHHEVFSILWSIDLLGNSEEDSKIRTAVLLHHYNEFFSGDKDITEILETYHEDVERYLRFFVSQRGTIQKFLRAYLGTIQREFTGKKNGEFIIEAVKELKSEMDFSRVIRFKEKVGAFGEDLSEEVSLYNPEKSDVDFLLFLGMLRRCDYSSSGDFDIEKVRDIHIIFGNIEHTISRRIKEKAKGSFKGLWQGELLKKHDLDYLAVIAPTGSGKTELAVLWAKNKGKLIYTLPLRVALNDLYRRLSREYFNDRHVGLLHSTAFMEYINGAGKEVDVEKKVNSAGLLAMPVMLSTPDQVFLTGLNYYGSDKVISVYPESAIVVDEVQAYTPEMVAVFLKTLKLIKNAGGKILIITATLPPHIKWYISGFSKDEANKLGVNPEEFPAPVFNFKVVDVAEEFEERKDDVKNLTRKRHKIEVIDKPLFEYSQDEETNKYGPVFTGKECVLEKITEKFEPNGLRTVIMVVNNVKKAIKAYDELKKALGDKWTVELLHSRLPEKRKQETIRVIKRLLEEHKKYRDAIKKGNIPETEPNPVLLVTTQVVEASVDADFDAMITEISPIDSQVQRWGRIYRNRDEDYDLDSPNIIIFVGKKDSENWRYSIDQGTIRVYGQGIGRKILGRTIEVLKSLERNPKPLDYKAERDAIYGVYSGEILREYITQVKELLDKLDYFTLEKKSEAQRVFRQLGGMYFVVPTLMSEEFGGDEIVKRFRKLLSEDKNSKLTWEEIIREVYQIDGELGRKELNNKKWELKKILQEYSVNVPIWFVLEDPILQAALYRTFKGYPVVLSWDKKKAEDLWKYGVDEVVKRDLDEVDIW
ncbi:hypothetical protein A3L11_06165 [Thermococcus siculi]|uniref:HD Cas3-type domain-containing protein n=1 Tax=Thermococcus siculi TaxID=72803 RepID=A0A2Z2MM02_9EURY|nr:CRISPR-associated helicase Cas3' [Thermococcus siculi]ASJ08828.1 hypothetical protein A3L11_06165 [Thermococcus siculi]